MLLDYGTNNTMLAHDCIYLFVCFSDSLLLRYILIDIRIDYPSPITSHSSSLYLISYFEQVYLKYGGSSWSTQWMRFSIQNVIVETDNVEVGEDEKEVFQRLRHPERFHSVRFGRVCDHAIIEGGMGNIRDAGPNNVVKHCPRPLA